MKLPKRDNTPQLDSLLPSLPTSSEGATSQVQHEAREQTHLQKTQSNAQNNRVHSSEGVNRAAPEDRIKVTTTHPVVSPTLPRHAGLYKSKVLQQNIDPILCSKMKTRPKSKTRSNESITMKKMEKINITICG